MAGRFELRHMFAAEVDGETVPVFFTRDNEHRLAELPESVLKDKIKKGYVVDVQMSAADLRKLRDEQTDESPRVEQENLQQANIDAARARGAKPTGGKR